MWVVFEHLAYPNKKLSKLNGMFKKGGAIVINTLNIGSPTVKYLGQSWSHYVPPHHLSFFSCNTIRNILEKNGFR